MAHAAANSLRPLRAGHDGKLYALISTQRMAHSTGTGITYGLKYTYGHGG